MSEAARPIVLTAEAAGGGRQWVQLLPAGPDIVGCDGRRWKMPDPAAVVAASLAANRPMPVDWEHAGMVRAEKGLEAPVAGWIEGLEVRDGSVWGKVEWTPRGANQVGSREYRFISPVFNYNGASSEVTRITGAGLTNNPNLELTALTRAGWKLEAEEPPKEPSEDEHHIARLLNMDRNKLAAATRS